MLHNGPARQGAALESLRKARRRGAAAETRAPFAFRKRASREEVRALKPPNVTAVAYSQETALVMGCRGLTAPANLAQVRRRSAATVAPAR